MVDKAIRAECVLNSPLDSALRESEQPYGVYEGRGVTVALFLLFCFVVVVVAFPFLFLTTIFYFQREQKQKEKHLEICNVLKRRK